MKNHITFTQISKLCFLFLFCLSMVNFISCNKDDDTSNGCSNIQTIDGTIKVNNESLKLTTAQSIISAGGASFGDTYLFQLAGVASDCNSVKSINFSINVKSGGSITGTFPIKDFFDANENDAYGSFTSQTLNPISQSLTDMVSGSIKVKDNGSKSYDIDLDAKLVGGESITLSISHKF